MIVDYNVRCEGARMLQRGERIRHFVQTELHVNNIAVRLDAFQTGVKHLDRIVVSVRGDLALKFLESSSVAVHGDEFPFGNRRIEKMPVAGADDQYRLIREVVKSAEIPS